MRLSAIGDCLHAVPVLTALRHKYPRAYVGWAIEAAAHKLLEGHPLVDRFHLFPRDVQREQGGLVVGRLRALNVFRRELAASRYEIALDLQGLTKSGLVAWWSGAGTRIGFAGRDGRELSRLFANRRVAPPAAAVHVVDRNLALLQGLGVEIPATPEWVLPSYEAEGREMDSFLQGRGLGAGGRRFAIVNPGATWATKRWPPECFGEVARGLVETHGVAAVAPWGDAAERSAAELIVRAAGGRDAFLAPPTNLRQLAALLARAILFVGNDTGPLHLAAALGIPCVAVFGASDPRRNGPYGPAHRIVASAPPCQPCWKMRCTRGDLACLRAIEPAQVLAGCAELLDR